MDDSYLNNKTWDLSSSRSFNFSDHVNESYYNHRLYTVFRNVELSLVCFGLVVTLAATFAVFSLMKKDNAAPVFIINLLISDLVQLCCNISFSFEWYGTYAISHPLYLVSIFASVGFMVCVSMDRYLLIAKPLWYRFRRNIKTSLVICAVVWAVAILVILTVIVCEIFHIFNPEIISIIIACVFLLPLPFFTFFLVGTIRALSAATSVLADEKRRIVVILILMVLVYILLFLPIVLLSLVPGLRSNEIFLRTTLIVLSISPLADSSLYILLRKSPMDKLFASLCCCKISNCWQTSSRHDDAMAALCMEAVQI